jgi:undecaprenyl diphosphate synthase
MKRTLNIPQENLPKHIAIIMDGNRRWAKKRGLPTFEGHRRGADNFEKLLRVARDIGIKCISAWAFSTENWKRSEEEKKYLFDLIREMVERYKEEFLKEKVKFVHLGRKDRVPDDVRKVIEDLEEESKDYAASTVALAIDYGGHDELVRCFQKLKDKDLDITEENIERSLDTAELPELDLIIRTGDVCRLSGFMSWQTAYAELYFSEKMFPAFSEKEFRKAIKDFAGRERRFGGDSKN